jgi:hypothetical protein
MRFAQWLYDTLASFLIGDARAVRFKHANGRLSPFRTILKQILHLEAVHEWSVHLGTVTRVDVIHVGLNASMKP